MAEATGVATETARASGITDSFVVGVALLVFAAALLVVGVELLVTCATIMVATPFGPDTVVCSYPFQVWGFVSLYFAAILTLIYFLAFVRDRELRDRKWKAQWSPLAISLMAGFLATGALVVALLVG